MFLPNQHLDHNKPLEAADFVTLGLEAAQEVERQLSYRDNHAPTPLHALPALAAALGVGTINVKDEGFRLGLGSFKALGGSYAVIRLVLEEASQQLGRAVDIAELHDREVRGVASAMTMACATDGNHGRSVAHGAQLGAKAAIFVHSGVSDERVAAIASHRIKEKGDLPVPSQNVEAGLPIRVQTSPYRVRRWSMPGSRRSPKRGHPGR